MRAAVDVDLVTLQRSVQLHHLEEVLRAGTCEQREAVRGGPQLRRQVFLDPANVPGEAGAGESSK